jgi:hypothetical protein
MNIASIAQEALRMHNEGMLGLSLLRQTSADNARRSDGVQVGHELVTDWS